MSHFFHVLTLHASCQVDRKMYLQKWETIRINPRSNSHLLLFWCATHSVTLSPERLHRSRSRAILRMVSTTFRTNASPDESGAVPVPASDLASKANREAALRQRGLLPPLKPSKDLSRLEWEQDQQLPAVNPADQTVAAIEGDVAQTVTAANLVKHEWEAKNRFTDTDSSRMESFKFGGLPSPVPTIVEQMSTEPGTGVESNNLFSLPIVCEQVDGSSPDNKPDVSSTSPFRNKRTPPPLVLDRLAFVASDYLLSPQSPVIPYKNEPHLVLLPPSPLPTPQRLRAASTSETADADDASSFPLPSSVNRPCTPISSRSALPAISLFHSPSASLDGATDLSRSGSLPLTQLRILSESASSETTPSLDTSSQTMTVSSLCTSESLPTTGKAKTNMLRVKVHDHNIPMIIESPVEETSCSKDSVLGSDISHDPSVERDHEHQSASPQMRQGQTAKSSFPTTARADKSSKDPVKRGQTLDPSTTVAAKKRLSVLSSVRRSVIGSLSRTKTSFNSGSQKTSNVSHLPPSPSVPLSFAEQARKYSPTVLLFPGPRHSEFGSVPPISRVAAAPTIHSQGSILHQMKNIKDEETRRVTELAFLG